LALVDGSYSAAEQQVPWQSIASVTALLCASADSVEFSYLAFGHLLKIHLSIMAAATGP